MPEKFAFFNKQQVGGIASYLHKSPGFRSFISDSHLFHPVSQALARRKAMKYQIWTIDSQAQLSGEEHEWNDETYKKWKKDSGITIYTTTKQVDTNLFITSDGEREKLYNESNGKSDIGFKKNEYIVIRQPDGSTDIDILSTLTKFATAESWFKDHYIKFQSMRIEFLEQLLQEAKNNGQNVVQIVNEAGASNTTNSPSPETVTHTITVEVKDEQTAKCINEILGAYPPDLLTQLAENVDLISDALTNPNEPEAKVSQIIGYIGELIYKQYLDKLGIEYKFSADNNEGRYDFILYPDKPEEERLYVDVKTNLYSFKEGNYPFYIHRAQNNFLNEKPSRQLCIVRISLTDIGLKDRYKDLQTQFKTDTNPRTNEKLRTDCEKIATSYWEKAKQITFEQASPQYWLSIADVKPKSSTPAI